MLGQLSDDTDSGYFVELPETSNATFNKYIDELYTRNIVNVLDGVNLDLVEGLKSIQDKFYNNAGSRLPESQDHL